MGRPDDRVVPASAPADAEEVRLRIDHLISGLYPHLGTVGAPEVEERRRATKALHSYVDGLDRKGVATGEKVALVEDWLVRRGYATVVDRVDELERAARDFDAKHGRAGRDSSSRR